MPLPLQRVNADPTVQQNFDQVQLAWPLMDGLATQATLRTLGTGAKQAASGSDSRLSDARTPTGTAGGDLTGTYPNPTLSTQGLQHFPQLVTAGAHKMAFGSSSIAASAAAVQKTSGNIAHGLGAEPAVILATATSGNRVASANSVGDSTNLTVTLRDSDNATWTTQQFFYWLAIS